jgi:hypothetical protein
MKPAMNDCSDDSRHPLREVQCEEAIKVIDKFEDVEDGVTTIRERERFTQTLTLAYAEGRTAILTDGSHYNEERSPEAGHSRVRQGDA